MVSISDCIFLLFSLIVDRKSDVPHYILSTRGNNQETPSTVPSVDPSMNTPVSETGFPNPTLAFTSTLDVVDNQDTSSSQEVDTIQMMDNSTVSSSTPLVPTDSVLTIPEIVDSQATPSPTSSIGNSSMSFVSTMIPTLKPKDEIVVPVILPRTCPATLSYPAFSHPKECFPKLYSFLILLLLLLEQFGQFVLIDQRKLLINQFMRMV